MRLNVRCSHQSRYIVCAGPSGVCVVLLCVRRSKPRRTCVHSSGSCSMRRTRTALSLTNCPRSADLPWLQRDAARRHAGERVRCDQAHGRAARPRNCCCSTELAQPRLILLISTCFLCVQAYFGLHGVCSSALRLFTVYGPWGRPDMSAFIFTVRHSAMPFATSNCSRTTFTLSCRIRSRTAARCLCLAARTAAPARCAISHTFLTW